MVVLRVNALSSVLKPRSEQGSHLREQKEDFASRGPGVTAQVCGRCPGLLSEASAQNARPLHFLTADVSVPHRSPF